MWALNAIVLALAIALPASVGGQGSVQIVSFRLEIESMTSNATDACNGGDVGLTNTSVLVQYRLTNSPQGTTLTEWRFLAEIDPKIGLDETLELPPHDGSSVQGVQFRLLQLEHGGGSCNCWRVGTAMVMWSGSNCTDNVCVENIRVHHCYRMSANQENQRYFCGGTASEARGFISNATQLKEGDGNSFSICPNNSDTMLISNKGSPLPQGCSTATPRM